MQEENYTVYFEVLLVKIYCLQGNMPPPPPYFIFASLSVGNFRTGRILSLILSLFSYNCVWANGAKLFASMEG